jgi:predicted nucleic acid-binding protein
MENAAPEVLAQARAQAVPQLPLTWLHTLEVGNALRVLTGRKLLTAEEARGLLEQFEDDRQAQRLADAALDWPKIFHESVQLSRHHAARLLCCSLDILHVAAAVELGCKRFVSADERQLALAEAIDAWKSPDRAAAAREACRQRASEFSMERNARETLRILKSTARP